MKMVVRMLKNILAIFFIQFALCAFNPFNEHNRKIELTEQKYNYPEYNYPANIAEQKYLRTLVEWKYLEFDYPTEVVRDNAIKRGLFRPGKQIPIDIDVYSEDGKNPLIFVTVPRFETGVPVTLGYVTDRTIRGNPAIAPYPNWTWNTPENCDNLISVFRIKIDAYNRLWILDTGKIGSKRLCPPQLLCFNLRDHSLLSRYRFPRDLYTDESLFVTPVVDIRPGRYDNDPSANTFVYIADARGFALIVYDHYHANAWRITNKNFYPYPQDGIIDIHGERFQLMDGLLGLALSPPLMNGDKLLFFHALSSKIEGWVSTSVIRNYTLFRNNHAAAPFAFRTFNFVRNGQSAAQDMDKYGILFFGSIGQDSISCWNMRNFPNYGSDTIDTIVVNHESLQYVSGVKVLRLGKQQDESLVVMTSPLQQFGNGITNLNKINFRIMTERIPYLVSNTKCTSSIP